MKKDNAQESFNNIIKMVHNVLDTQFPHVTAVTITMSLHGRIVTGGYIKHTTEWTRKLYQVQDSGAVDLPEPCVGITFSEKNQDLAERYRSAALQTIIAILSADEKYAS